MFSLILVYLDFHGLYPPSLCQLNPFSHLHFPTKQYLSLRTYTPFLRDTLSNTRPRIFLSAFIRRSLKAGLVPLPCYMLLTEVYLNLFCLLASNLAIFVEDLATSLFYPFFFFWQARVLRIG